MKKPKNLIQKAHNTKDQKKPTVASDEFGSVLEPIRFKEITSESGGTTLDIDTNSLSEGLQHTTGTFHTALGINLILQVLAAACENKKVEVRKANAVSEALSEIAPKDGLEGMLAAQMVAVHSKAMDLLSRANNTNFIPKIETCLNLSVKLLRTFTAQMEALNKYRRGGEQKVTVEHFHIHKGGQAIVGNVTQERGGRNEK